MLGVFIHVYLQQLCILDVEYVKRTHFSDDVNRVTFVWISNSEGHTKLLYIYIYIQNF